jgi:hypothetical protein
MGELEAMAEAEALTQPLPSDRGGYVLGGLKALRRLRLRALAAESARLEGRVEAKRKGKKKKGKQKKRGASGSDGGESGSGKSGSGESGSGGSAGEL